MLTAMLSRVAASLGVLVLAATVAGAEPVAVLATNHGEIAIRFVDGAPQTAAQFRRLVEEGFYDGTNFYRVVDGHVIQAGDGGENEQPTVPAEFGAYPHVTGAVGLARAEDPDSGSTEFYICVAPRPHLDGRYAVFGLVADGHETVLSIARTEVEERFVGEEGSVAFHQPVEDVVIERAWIEERDLAPLAALEAGATTDAQAEGGG